ncbi:MAG TPA: AI-2E family transporter [Gammaproteobacteria bacterium]|nr:AI-2E family transporter [Gammaproteobacteria bacterium]
MSIANARDWPRTLVVAAKLTSFAIVCALLYWGREVLIPIALAVLVSFLLSPFVIRLDKLGLPRVVSVVLVVGIATALIAGVGWIVGGQLTQLGSELPSYEQNIKTKIADLRAMFGGGALEGVQSTINDINKDIQNGAKAGGQGGATPTAPQERPPVPVKISPSSGLLGEAKLIGPVLETAATAALIMLLSIFILIKREDLRNRFVSLAGRPSLASTTKAFSEVGQVISRYLLTQFLVNATIGILAWLGLYFIGVPYSALWGLGAGVLRYVPYVGPTTAALLPILVSLVTSPGWEQVLLVVGLFALIEAIANYALEPLAYGHSVGLSAIAIIIAAVFWTWLWGPVGLVIATPMTACLVVFGRYFPVLAPLDRMLGEQPALDPPQQLYQRLLAHDEDEAEEILAQHLAGGTLEETCDALLLGTLLMLKRDLTAGSITAEDGEGVAATLRAMIDDLQPDEEAEDEEAEDGEAEEERGDVPRQAEAPALAEGRAEPEPARELVRLCGFPVHDSLDEIALELLRVMFRGEPCELEILSSGELVGERISRLEASAPSAACVVSVSPGDLSATRYAVKRLRTQLPGLKLAIGRLGSNTATERSRQLAKAVGVHEIAGSLRALRAELLPAVHAAHLSRPKEAPAAVEAHGAVSLVSP